MKLFQKASRILHCLGICLAVAMPGIGWSADISDRPLFIAANLDHNLMFIVDDSGSMDFEVLAPAVGVASAEVESYIFNPGAESGNYPNSKYATGRRILGNSYIRAFNEQYFYLRSSDYNLQYYDPAATYNPWPSTSTRTYTHAAPNSARLDPGLSGTITADLQQAGALGLPDNAIPATFFVKNSSHTVERLQQTWLSCPAGWDTYQTTQCRRCTASHWFWGCTNYEYQPRPSVQQVVATQQCADISSNWYSDWHANPSSYSFKSPGGTIEVEGDYGFAPDGACLERIELKSGNEDKVLAATGDTLAVQLQNFANWFEYYRRRHQAIRGAVAESVYNIENMRLGVFWLHNRRNMDGRLYNANTQLNTFLDEQYARFDDGNWTGGGTPNRQSLQHAGREYAKVSVRGRLECRKNYTLLFTDGFSNNLGGFTSDAGNADKDAPAPFGNPSFSNTLGDIAYYYYQGLRDSTGGIIPGGRMRIRSECGTGAQKPWMDCNTNYNMNTFTVGLGMQGEKYAGITHFKVMDAHNNPPDWGSVAMGSNDSSAQIDDLYHAAVNGKGEYYDAQSTTDLIASLQRAVNDIQRILGSGSNASFNSGSLSDGAVVYSAQFTSGTWVGTVRAETLDEDGVVLSTEWDAASVLDSRDLEASPRLILTYGQDGGSRAGTVFEWENLTSAQQADLRLGGNDELGKARLEFLRGKPITAFNGTPFRQRESLMGPVVNSSPEFVGPPAKNWPNTDPFGADGDRYGTYRAAQQNRQKVVYAGANDGMLHGFDANTGEEVLAYIPGFLFSDQAGEGLHNLTQASYEYRSYVDLPVAVSDVHTGGDWRTIVISGARAGARGIFALDVTDPASFSAAKANEIVMWEFTADDDANLGHLTSAVQISLLQWGPTDFRWSAVFENGYGTDKNGIFVLDIGKPSNVSWQKDVNYKFIELANGQGLSPLRLVDYKNLVGAMGADGIADRAYAGDLEGRLWAVDLTGDHNTWGSVYGVNPLFTTASPSGGTQPISARPIAAYNDFEKSHDKPNLIVLFGTGRYLMSDDLSDKQVQSFYGINDRMQGGLTRSNLESRKLYEETHPAPELDIIVRRTDEDAIDWMANHGWHLDFDTQSGERVVSGAQVRGNYVVFPTAIPLAEDPCAGGGTSWIMAVRLDGSTDADRAVIDVDGDGELTELDKGWAGISHDSALVNHISIIGDVLIGAASDASKPTVLTDFGGAGMSARRVSWREVLPE